MHGGNKDADTEVGIQRVQATCRRVSRSLFKTVQTHCKVKLTSLPSSGLRTSAVTCPPPVRVGPAPVPPHAVVHRGVHLCGGRGSDQTSQLKTGQAGVFPATQLFVGLHLSGVCSQPASVQVSGVHVSHWAGLCEPCVCHRKSLKLSVKACMMLTSLAPMQCGTRGQCCSCSVTTGRCIYIWDCHVTVLPEK